MRALLIATLVVISTSTVAAQARYTYNYHNHTTDERGIELLKKAVQDGYRAGFNAGKNSQATAHAYDRHFRRNLKYSDASIGYKSGLVPKTDYKNYFRDGFELGFDDGWEQRSRCGSTGDISEACLNEVLVVHKNN